MFHGSTQVGQWSAPSPITCLDVISNDDNEAANSKKRRYFEDGELATAGKLVVGDRAGGLHILTVKKLLGQYHLWSTGCAILCGYKVDLKNLEVGLKIFKIVNILYSLI